MKKIQHMPAVALRGLTVLPGVVLHFDISREKSKLACNQAMKGKKNYIFLVAQKDINITDPDRDDLFDIGCIAKIRQLIKLPGGNMRVLVEGLDRARLEDMSVEEGYIQAAIRPLENQDSVAVIVNNNDDREPLSEELSQEVSGIVGEAELRQLKELFKEYAAYFPRVAKTFVARCDTMMDLSKLIDEITGNIPLGFELKQRVLEGEDVSERFVVLIQILEREIQIARVRSELSKGLQTRVDKHQKEYILREQLQFIREELGEENVQTEAEELEEKLNNIKCSDEVREKIAKEIKRFKNMSTHSGEVAMERSYIETLLEMPWDNRSKDRNNIKTAERILDRDHYGLDKVKERILETLAVRVLKEKSKTNESSAPILCLVGPPGTGKTSIARSVAESLNKKYVRISLGGVRDEAEIRGHRRTYIGSMPGRIAQGLRQAGVKNPLMLLDEIDKAGTDARGDTSSALLEVLDGEQNVSFRDHYIEIPLDLSEVLFIATANDAQAIPGPLRDRMELIEVTSYTANEKLHIAERHLFAKQLEKNGLGKKELKITSAAMKKVIEGYTREAGVRGLERNIGKICRKAARLKLECKDGNSFSVKVTPDNLEEYLGKIKYRPDKKNEEDMVGIVRGLAWTSVGGDTLEIEVNIMPGKGSISLTGQMGDVMKESAQTGISYIRSVADKYKISKTAFSKQDVHIHIPEGAVPKDGPSAGITMATAVLSALTGRAVKANLAMTGEITLRGRVLPIGGLKEKLLAAKTAGITQILIPEDNLKDLEEISEEILEGLDITGVKSMEEVIERAFA